MKKSNGNWFLIAVLAALVLFSLLFIAKNKPSEKQTVNIGAIIPLTGNYSDVGDWMRKGMDMAIEDFNSAHECQLSINYEDSKSDPKAAISSYQKLKSTKNIQFYVSTVSSVCLALKPLVKRDSRFLFVNAGHKDLVTEDVPSLFRHALTIPQEARFMSEQIKKDSTVANDTRIAMLYTNNEIGIEFKDVFVQDYGTYSPVTSVISYEENESELKNIVMKLLVKKPQVVVIYGYTKNFGQVITAIREQGFKGKIYANQGFSTPSAIENAGLSGNNVFYSDYDIPDNEEMNSLCKRFKLKYNQDLSSMNITSYNIMYLIGLAVDSVGADVKSVISYLNNNSPYYINGMKITIDQGEVYVPLKLVQNIYKK